MLGFTIFALVFVGGFSVMSIEMLAGRVLAPYFGGSIYVWGSVITIFMLVYYRFSGLNAVVALAANLLSLAKVYP